MAEETSCGDSDHRGDWECADGDSHGEAAEEGLRGCANHRDGADGGDGGSLCADE